MKKGRKRDLNAFCVYKAIFLCIHILQHLQTLYLIKTGKTYEKKLKEQIYANNSLIIGSMTSFLIE